MKYLIACLGNIGAEYDNTRHNIGFKVADRLAKDLECSFTTGRLAQTAEVKYRGKTLLIIKPTTYMNLSGNAVRYWLNKENIDEARMLVVVDDLSLPLGTLRLKASGSAGTHNGLGHIQQLIGQKYPRLRVGIGNDFPRGAQVDYVLGAFGPDELEVLRPQIATAVEMIKSFVLAGIDITMNQFNKRHPSPTPQSPKDEQ